MNKPTREHEPSTSPAFFLPLILRTLPILYAFVASIILVTDVHVVTFTASALPNNCAAGGSGRGLSFDWRNSDVIGLHWTDVPTKRLTAELWFANGDVHLTSQNLISYSVYNVDGHYGKGGDPYESANEILFAVHPWQIRVWTGGKETLLDEIDNPRAATYASGDWRHYAFSVDVELGEVAIYVDGEMLDFRHFAVELELDDSNGNEEGKETLESCASSPFSNRWDAVNHDDSLPYLGRNTRRVVLVDDACPPSTAATDTAQAPTSGSGAPVDTKAGDATANAALPDLRDAVALLKRSDGCSAYEQAARAEEGGAWAVILEDDPSDDEAWAGATAAYSSDGDGDGSDDNQTQVGGGAGNKSRLNLPVLLCGEEDHGRLRRAHNVTLVRTRQLYSRSNVVEPEAGGVLHVGQESDRNWGDFDEMQALTGVIDEFRVWDVVRTQDQIKNKYKKSIDVTSDVDASHLAIYWKFDDQAVAADAEASSSSSSSPAQRSPPSLSVAVDSSPGGGNDGLVGNLPTIDNQIQYFTDRPRTRPTAPRWVPTTKCPLVGDGEVLVPAAAGKDTVVELKSLDPDGDDLRTEILSLPSVGSLFPVSPDYNSSHAGSNVSSASEVSSIATVMAATREAFRVNDIVVDGNRTENKRVVFRAPADFDGDVTFRYSVRDDDGAGEPVEATVRLVRHVVETPKPRNATIDEDSLAYFALTRPSLLSQKNMQVVITKLPSRGQLYQAQFNPTSSWVYATIATEVGQYGPMDQIDRVNTTVFNDRGIVLYRPNQDEYSTAANGEMYASFAFKLLDVVSGEESDEAVQSIFVSAVNDHPVAMPTNASVPSRAGAGGKDGLAIQLRGTDVDADALESFADRSFARITSFPRAGRVYQFDAASNDAHGDYMDSSATEVPMTFAWASRVVRASSHYSQCGADCYSWHNPRCTSNDVLAGGWSNGTCSELGWHSSQILGEPDVWPEYSGSKLGWILSKENYGHEWIELEFPFDVYISGLELYEIFKTGAVWRISTTSNYTDDPDISCTGNGVPGIAECAQRTKWQTLWSKPRTLLAPGKEEANVFNPPLCPSVKKTRIVRLDLDTRAVPGWNTYDAAKLSGRLSAPPGVLRDGLNRIWYHPDDGVHGNDKMSFRISDCLDEGPEADVAIRIHEPPKGNFTGSVFASESVVLDTTPGTIVEHIFNATAVLTKIREHTSQEPHPVATVWHTTALGAVAGEELRPASLSSPFIQIKLGTATKQRGYKVELFLRDASGLTFHLMLNVTLLVLCENGQVNDEGVCICRSARWTGPDCATEVAEDTNTIPAAMKAVAYTMFAIIGLAIVASFMFIQRYRDTRQVGAAQPFFLRLVLIGCLLSCSAIITIAQEEDNVACALVPWLYSLGESIVFGSLFAKSLRVYKIYLEGAGPRRKNVTVREFVRIIVALLAVDIIVLTAWTINDPLRWVRTVDATDVFGYVLSSTSQCRSKNGIPYLCALAALHILTLALSLFLCYRSRGIPTRFSEGKFIALAIASNLEVLVLGIPVLVIVYSSARTAFFVASTIIFLNNVAVMGFIFGNLVIKVNTGYDDDGIERDSKVVRENNLWHDLVKSNENMKEELKRLRKSLKKSSFKANCNGTADESFIYYESPPINELPESEKVQNSLPPINESSEGWESENSDETPHQHEVWSPNLDELAL